MATEPEVRVTEEDRAKAKLVFDGDGDDAMKMWTDFEEYVAKYFATERELAATRTKLEEAESLLIEYIEDDAQLKFDEITEPCDCQMLVCRANRFVRVNRARIKELEASK
jgi:hypothetical protein